MARRPPARASRPSTRRLTRLFSNTAKRDFGTQLKEPLGELLQGFERMDVGACFTSSCIYHCASIERGRGYGCDYLRVHASCNPAAQKHEVYSGGVSVHCSQLHRRAGVYCLSCAVCVLYEP